jgi:hypothetical protein
MQLVLVGYEDDFQLPLDRFTAELLAIRAIEAKEANKLTELSACLAEVIREALQSGANRELREPTAPQVTYAIDIARELGIPLPAEVLRYRGCMSAFLARFSVHFRDQLYGGIPYIGG